MKEWMNKLINKETEWKKNVLMNKLTRIMKNKREN